MRGRSLLLYFAFFLVFTAYVGATDYALGKSCYASSVYSATHTCNAAFDGDNATDWLTVIGLGWHSIQVDLNASYNITTLNWKSSFADGTGNLESQIKVYSSTDNSSWTLRDQDLANTLQYRTFQFEPAVSARYWKVELYGSNHKTAKLIEVISELRVTIYAPKDNHTTFSSSFSFSPTLNSTCGYWLNGSYSSYGVVEAGVAGTGSLATSGAGDYNFTVVCWTPTSANVTSTSLFSMTDNYSFRAFDDLSSIQLANFSIEFKNSTNTTTYIASGEWLNVSRAGLPRGDVNLTVQKEGYNYTTFFRNFNDSDTLYENYAITPAGLNVFAFDEETEERIYFKAVISNTTTTLTWENVLNITEYYLNSSFPTGSCTIDVSTANSSYYERRYFATISNTSYYWLNAYLLNQSSDVILVRFHIRNKMSEPVEGASMNVLKSIGGASVTVGQGKSDAAGDIVIYLLLNEPYSIQVTHPDYADYYTTINPSTNDYTIVLGGEEDLAYLPYGIYDDVSWLLSPYSNAITEEVTNFTLYVTSENSSLYCWGMNVSYNGTLLYTANITGSPSGGVVYYSLNWSNATNYSTTGNITVSGWFKVNPPGGFTRNYFGHIIEQSETSFHAVQEDFVNSGLSSLSFAIVWCLLALLGGAWVGRRNVTAGLVFIVFILAMGALGGWLDVSTGTVSGGWFGGASYVISGWYIVAFSVILSISMIYLRERWN